MVSNNTMQCFSQSLTVCLDCRGLLSPQFPILSRQKWNLLWSSAAVAPPQGSWCSEMLFLQPCCDTWLFELLLLTCQLEPVQPFFSDLLFSHMVFLPTGLMLTECFCYFVICIILLKLQRLLCMKIRGDQQFPRYSNYLSGTNNHSTVKVTQIAFLTHSDVWSEQQLNVSTIPACFMHLVVANIGRLDICISNHQECQDSI